MRMPDGIIYRWERSDDGGYRYLMLRGGVFREVAKGSRQDALEWAKQLRDAGGIHPFRSVTQLVAKSFPLSLVLHEERDRTTTGGPGTACFCQYHRTLEVLVYANDRACLRENFREWGFGWSDRRKPITARIPHPLSEEGVQEAAENLRIGASGLYERIKSGFPWLVA